MTDHQNKRTQSHASIAVGCVGLTTQALGRWARFTRAKGAGELELKRTRKEQSMKLSELTWEQLELIAEHRPAWLAYYLPGWLAEHRPDLLTEHRPGWKEPDLPEEIEELLKGGKDEENGNSYTNNSRNRTRRG